MAMYRGCGKNGQGANAWQRPSSFGLWRTVLRRPLRAVATEKRLKGKQVQTTKGITQSCLKWLFKSPIKTRIKQQITKIVTITIDI